MSLSFTADIFKSMLTTCMIDEFLRDLVNSDAFKKSLKDFDINEYITDEVIEDISEKIFSNTVFKKKLRTMIIKILSDMNIKDEVDSNDDSCDCGIPPCRSDK